MTWLSRRFRLARALPQRPDGWRRLPSLGTVLAASVVVGVVSGLGAVAFFWLLEATRHVFLDLAAGWRPSGPGGEPPLFGHGDGPLRPWLLYSLPALGGLAGGLLVWKLAPEAEGHGTDAAIEAYHYRQGAIRGVVPPVKALASAITIGTGGSAGREGPIAQIGAGMASVLARKLGLARRDRALLMAAGVAGGIGAIFHAPLAGAIFAAEVMYRELDIEHEVIVPSFISSIIAYSVFSLVFGWSPLFERPEYTFDRPVQLIPYLVLALVVAGGAALFVRVFYGTRDCFARLAVPPPLRPALGGLLVGLTALGLAATGVIEPGYGVLSSGYGVIQEGLADPGKVGIAALLAVALGKMLTTAFTVGSGGSGGVFGPCVVIGGALGGAVGLVSEAALPGADIHPGAFVMVGMAGFFAAAGRTPLSTIIMVGEMTGNYRLLVPSMLVCVVAFLLAGRRSIFENQLASRLDAPSKVGNMMAAVLNRIPIEHALGHDEASPLLTIRRDLPLRKLLDRFSDADQDCFPLVDEKGRLLGVIDGRSIRYTLADESVLADLVVAADLASEAVTLTPRESLLEAVRRMGVSHRDEIVIVDEKDPSRPVGTLSHADVVAQYNRELTSQLG